MASYYSFLLLLLIGSHGPRLSESNIVAAHRAANVAVSAFFVFGDSSADTGNNNFIPTTFRSNFPPYGRDFVNHMPTGSFANGKVGADYLISYLGLKETIPPYLDPSLSEEELLTGVNFASAGAGLDPFTSSLSVSVCATVIEVLPDVLRNCVVPVGAKHIKESPYEYQVIN